ncbi:MAG: ABC transporter substrate-binding protein [Clostridia bacterium]|nr:ABC transporter substrate-binding protein [Clostridia bacterium]
MKKILSVLMAALLIAAVCLTLASCGDDGKYTIGICQQMPHAALDSATQGFKDALTEELGAENLTFLDQNAQGESTACTTIINDFVSKNVDLILANATTALQAAANGTPSIPVLGTSVTEYGTALGIENFDGLVGSNVSGTSDLAPLDQQAAMILELYPDTKTVGLLYCSAEPNSAYQVKVVRENLEASGVTCTEFPFADSNDLVAVSTAAAAASDVIYIPTDNTAASFAESINGAVLPTGTPIMGGDEGICSGCGIATLCINYSDLGYTTGKMAAKVLTGEAKIEEMPIAYSEKFQKVYNPVNCAELGVDIAALEAAGYTAIGSN